MARSLTNPFGTWILGSREAGDRRLSGPDANHHIVSVLDTKITDLGVKPGNEDPDFLNPAVTESASTQLPKSRRVLKYRENLSECVRKIWIGHDFWVPGSREQST